MATQAFRFVLILLCFYLYAPMAKADLKDKSTQNDILITNINSESGLPDNWVKAMLFDSSHFMWIGTKKGLVRYSGTSFKLFTTENSALQSDYITELHESKNHTIWVGTSKGVALIYPDGNSTVINEAQGLSAQVAISFFETQKGMWIASYGDGLYFYNYQTKTCSQMYSTETGLVHNSVWTIKNDSKNRLWIGTNDGISVLENNSITNYTQENGLSNTKIRFIYEDESNTIWVGTDGGGMFYFDGKKFIPFSRNNELPNLFIMKMDKNNLGEWEIATFGGGFVRLKANSVQIVNKESGLTDDVIWNFIRDLQGSLWLGTFSGGVFKLTKSSVSVLDISNGLSQNYISSMVEDKNGLLWLASYGGGVMKEEKDGTFKTISLRDGLSNEFAYSIAVDNRNSIWVATQGGGLNLIQNDKITRVFRATDSIPDNFIRSVFVDKDNVIWVGTDHGLGKIIPQKNNTFKSSKLINKGFTFALKQDSSGIIWQGTRGLGLLRIRNDSTLAFGDEINLTNRGILDIYIDKQNQLWLASEGLGLVHFNPTTHQFFIFNKNNGLIDNIVTTLIEDDYGFLWLGTEKGINRISMEELRTSISENTPDKQLEVLWLNKQDGLPTVDIHGRSSPNVLKRASGELWFPSSKGVIKLDPKRFLVAPNPSKLILNKFVVDSKEIQFEPNEELQYGFQNIELHYGSIDFFQPEKIFYEFKLENYQTEWVKADHRKTAYFTKIPAGDYSFLVRSRNNFGVLSEPQTLISLHILPPFWQTAWFISLVFIFLSYLVWFVSTRNLRKQLRLAETQRQIHQDRERISAELHDNIGAQLSGLVSGIEVVQLYLGANDLNQAKEVLDHLDEDTRFTIASLRQMIWALNKDEIEFNEFISYLHNYIKRQISYQKDYTLDFKSDIDSTLILDTSTTIHLVRIVQEIISNSFKYAQATKLECFLSLEKNNFVLFIKDNGLGFSNKDDQRFGFGIKNINKRVSELKGICNIHSEENKGVAYTISIPLKYHL